MCHKSAFKKRIYHVILVEFADVYNYAQPHNSTPQWQITKLLPLYSSRKHDAQPVGTLLMYSTTTHTTVQYGQYNITLHAPCTECIPTP